MTFITLSGLLSFSSVLGRKLDKHVFERRTHFVNLGVTDANFAQLLVNLSALDALIHQQMHGLTEDSRTAHSLHLMHCTQRCGNVIASHVKSARSRRIYVRQFF